MTSNRDRAAEVIWDAQALGLAKPRDLADELDDAGLLAPEPIPLDEDDRSEVLDALLKAQQSANIFGPRRQATAWEVASLLFDAHTTPVHAQKEENNE